MTSDIDSDRQIEDVVGKLNETSAKGPIGALLTPAFTVFGQRLGDLAARMTNRRVQNVESHVAAVRHMNPCLEFHATPERERDLFEWAEEAANKDNINKESLIWRGLLERIMRSSGSNRIHIDLARRLSIDDVEFMLISRGKRMNIINAQMEYLLHNGAIYLGARYLRIASIPSIVIFFIGLILVLLNTSAPEVFLGVEFSAMNQWNLYPAFLIPGVLMMLLGAVWSYKLFTKQRLFSHEIRLSPTADDIVNMYQKYAGSDPKD